MLDFVVLRASKGRHIFEDTTLHFALLFLIDFIVFRATKGSCLAPEKEPRWHKTLNSIFTETNEKLNLVDNSNDTLFSLLNNEYDVANSQNSDKLEAESDSNHDISDPTKAKTSGIRPTPIAKVFITLPSM